MIPQHKAEQLVTHFNYHLDIRKYEKAKQCAIYLCHSIIWETLEVEKIKFYKDVINEIEKL